MVPPHGRDEDRVARLKLHRPRFRHRIDEARMRGEVGGIEIDHAHRAARGRVVDRPQIEVAKLVRSEEHTSELQSLMRISYAVFCLKKKKNTQQIEHTTRL